MTSEVANQPAPSIRLLFSALLLVMLLSALDQKRENIRHCLRYF